MSYQLTIEPLGETLMVEDGQSLLDAALRAGVWLPYACNHGLCGTCKVDVVNGLVEHNHASSFALMDIEREEGKCLACCATLASDAVIEADVELEPDARALPIADYHATVTRIETLTPTIRGIWLALEGEGVEFQAGQYVNVAIPGLAQPRAFSIASAPSARHEIELNVRLVDGGAGTTWLHDNLGVGDALHFTAPLGRFFVRKSAPEPVIFLAGGSGLSSPKSMIVDLLEEGDAREITLIHGARTPDELYYAALFRRLEQEHRNFHYLAVVSEAQDDTPWDGPRGFVHDAAEQHFGGHFAGHKAYLCGPPAMIDACLTSLMRGRLFEEHIFMENFYTGADAATPPRRSALFKKF
ncbi:MAG: 2Fe-2S iron-sulfur cluster binding domain-containing protein [Gammaproteobacteria bacterium]